MTCGDNMWQQMARGMISLALLSALVGCGGAHVEGNVAVRPVAIPPSAAPVVASRAAPPAGLAALAPHAPARGHALVSESERRAEETRLVDFEQSYSIEMNRLSREQAGREQRSALALRAGVVQGPGCEGTEGHAALECERSLL